MTNSVGDIFCKNGEEKDDIGKKLSLNFSIRSNYQFLKKYIFR